MAAEDANTTPKDDKAQTPDQLADQLLSSVKGEINKARKQKLQGTLKGLVEKQVAAETSLNGINVEIKQFLDNVRAGTV